MLLSISSISIKLKPAVIDTLASPATIVSKFILAPAINSTSPSMVDIILSTAIVILFALSNITVFEVTESSISFFNTISFDNVFITTLSLLNTFVCVLSVITVSVISISTLWTVISDTVSIIILSNSVIYNAPPFELILLIDVSIKLSTVPVEPKIFNLNSSAVILFVSVLLSDIELASKLISPVVINWPNVKLSVALYLIFELLASVVIASIVIISASTSTVPTTVISAFWVNVVATNSVKFAPFVIALFNENSPDVAWIRVSPTVDTIASPVISISVATRTILPPLSKLSWAILVVLAVVPSLLTLSTFIVIVSTIKLSVSVMKSPLFSDLALNVEIVVSIWFGTVPIASVIFNNKEDATISTSTSLSASLSIKLPPAVMLIFEVPASIYSIVISLPASNKILPLFVVTIEVSSAIVISVPAIKSIVLVAVDTMILEFCKISLPEFSDKLPWATLTILPTVISDVPPIACNNISPTALFVILPVVVIEPASAITTISPDVPSERIELMIKSLSSSINISPLVLFVSVISAIVVSISSAPIPPIPIFAVKFTTVVSPKIFAVSRTVLSLIAPVVAVIVTLVVALIIEISIFLWAV